MNNEIKRTFSEDPGSESWILFYFLCPSPNEKPAIFPSDLTKIVLHVLFSQYKSLTLIPVYICSCTKMVLFHFYLEPDRHLSHTPCFCC